VDPRAQRGPFFQQGRGCAARKSDDTEVVPPFTRCRRAPIDHDHEKLLPRVAFLSIAFFHYTELRKQIGLDQHIILR
jgi:hypothetical protein